MSYSFGCNWPNGSTCDSQVATGIGFNMWEDVAVSIELIQGLLQCVGVATARMPAWLAPCTPGARMSRF